MIVFAGIKNINIVKKIKSMRKTRPSCSRFVLHIMVVCSAVLSFSCASNNTSANEEMSISFAGVEFTTSINNLSYKGVDFCGEVHFGETYTAESFGVVCSTDSIPRRSSEIMIEDVFDTKYKVSSRVLRPDTKYYYALYVQHGDVYRYSDVRSFTTKPHPYTIKKDINAESAIDLSLEGTANCYIVSEPGTYKIKAVKGNSSEPVGDVVSAEILWECCTEGEETQIFDLLSAVCYKDDYVLFRTSESFKHGNVLIAAKEVDGNILWSWHIWLADKPQEQTYYNNAGVMMDRNLGAKSPYSQNCLWYQWGRKDPFPSLYQSSRTTIYFWPSSVYSDQNCGTIEYATRHPMTRIEENGINGDWCYSTNSTIDDTRWTTSEEAKSIYDPCPYGWRVPDGGPDGVWARALGSAKPREVSVRIEEGEDYDKMIKLAYTYGNNYFKVFGDSLRIWYSYECYYGWGRYWSASPNNKLAYSLLIKGDNVHPSFSKFSQAYPHSDNHRANAYYVRCIKE